MSNNHLNKPADVGAFKGSAVIWCDSGTDSPFQMEHIPVK